MDNTEAEITKLIKRLESLREGDQAVNMLVACGKIAIPYLRKYLLNGTPSHIYQPRQRAVIALAQLGAKEVLMEYLSTPKNISDPVIHFGEEAVENTAARLLANWQSDDVFALLLRIAHERTLPGIIETLGLFRRPDSVPLFITALMDDITRNAAENALKAVGEQAKPALMEVLKTHCYSEEIESPSHLLRCRSVMRILVDLPIEVTDWSIIEKLLHDNDPEISILAARLALRIADREQKKTIIKRLIERIPFTNWCLDMEIEDCLVEYYDVAKKEIEEQFLKCKARPVKEQAYDRVLQILLHVQRRRSWMK